MIADSLLPSNASASERALAIAARFGDDILPEDVKTLWQPNEAAPEFLPFMGWGLHVDFWRDALPDKAKRSLIAESFEWHRQEGTFGAIRRICEAAFGETAIEAWHQYGGEPYSFRITAGQIPLQSQADWDALTEAIYTAKALRDWLDTITIQREAGMAIRYGHGSVQSGQMTIMHRPTNAQTDGTVMVGIGSQKSGEVCLYHRPTDAQTEGALMVGIGSKKSGEVCLYHRPTNAESTGTITHGTGSVKAGTIKVFYRPSEGIATGDAKIGVGTLTGGRVEVVHHERVPGPEEQV
ncbi:MAG: phage tail protein I, partial [Synergistaceae bacterium]|nr:phage tail protein I [Synergistaceae bacterium]